MKYCNSYSTREYIFPELRSKLYLKKGVEKVPTFYIEAYDAYVGIIFIKILRTKGSIISPYKIHVY